MNRTDTTHGWKFKPEIVEIKFINCKAINDCKQLNVELFVLCAFDIKKRISDKHFLRILLVFGSNFSVETQKRSLLLYIFFIIFIIHLSSSLAWYLLTSENFIGS